MRSDFLTSTSTLEHRRLAVVAALRSLDDVTRAPEPAPAPAAAPPVDTELSELRAEVRRLAERVERVEDKVDLIRDGDDTPLAWPVSVDSDSRLEVPPFEVSRTNSPAFDILLGPPQRDTA